jgi:hypothetical protein
MPIAVQPEEYRFLIAPRTRGRSGSVRMKETTFKSSYHFNGFVLSQDL